MRLPKLVCLMLALAGAAPADGAAPAADGWVGVWGAPPAFPNGPSISQRTLRQVVRLSLGGRSLRIRLSNELGSSPVVIGAAHVARPGTAAGSIDLATDQVLTFGGSRSVVLEPGVPMLSDPVAFSTATLEHVAVSLYVTRATGPTAVHGLGLSTAYLSSDELHDGTADVTLHGATTASARFFLAGVEVTTAGAAAVVTLGDSITDGYGSTPDSDRRWPDALAERLAERHRPIAVVNAGLSGNRILHDLPQAEYGPSALARFDRDVLAVAGVRTVILLESINDIGSPGSSDLLEQAVTADQIIAGMAQLIARAHAHGVRIVGATLVPYADTIFAGYYSADGEAKRQTVNRYIREQHDFDGVVDFDAALRDPERPAHMLAAYDCGDHLHPNDLGYRKMAEAVSLELLEAARR